MTAARALIDDLESALSAASAGFRAQSAGDLSRGHDTACETDVGAVPSGDGVYGLRPALVLAGAASQVVSLWSGSDASTRELMRDYYGELARGTGRAEALRRAKLRLMLQPRYAHPSYWVAFMPAGDWRRWTRASFDKGNRTHDSTTLDRGSRRDSYRRRAT